jgi:uncharacterized repeat protein (TIGR01451 family)
MGRKVGILLMAIFIGLPLAAWAGPQVGIRVVAQKEVKVQQDGKTIVKRVAAETVEPGEVIFYTLKYENKGDQKATDVVVNNPIPEGTVYLAESAYGEGSTIVYSMDDGKTFDKPEALRVSYTMHDGKKMSRRAYASEYTHIRWVVGEVAASGNGVLGFQVKVK